jgi:hypothetical protein
MVSAPSPLMEPPMTLPPLARLDQNLVVHRQLAQRHVLQAAVGHQLVRVGGHQFGQFLERL